MNLTILEQFDIFHKFSEIEKRDIFDHFQAFKVPSNTILLREGEIAESLFWLDIGIVREVTKGEDNEDETFWILGDKNWFFSIESYVTGNPSKCALETLFISSGFSISKKSLEFLSDKYPRIDKVIRNLQMKYFLKLEYRNRLLRIKNASARLEIFETQNPQLANKLKIKTVASLLNINASELSRIRSKRRSIFI